MDTDNYINLLNFYSNVYSATLNEFNTENNGRWNLFIVYLTGIIGITGYAIYRGNIYFLLAIPILHIGWFYGISVKVLLLTYCEENLKYLESVINNILKKVNPDFIKYELVRNNKLYVKAQGDYTKPFKHTFSGFIMSFYSIPILILVFYYYYVISNLSTLNTESKIPDLAIICILILYILIMILIGFFYARASYRLAKESNILIKNIDRQKKK